MSKFSVNLNSKMAMPDGTLKSVVRSSKIKISIFIIVKADYFQSWFHYNSDFHRV